MMHICNLSTGIDSYAQILKFNKRRSCWFYPPGAAAATAAAYGSLWSHSGWTEQAIRAGYCAYLKPTETDKKSRQF